MGSTQKAAAYDLAHHLDPDLRAQFFDDDPANDLTDMVRMLWESHTPDWLFYYLSEVEKPSNLGAALSTLLDEETINHVAQKCLDADGPIINLNNPASHNWMSEDPMAPVRREYEDKRAAIGDALVDAYTTVFADDIPKFDDPDFQSWFRDGCLDDLNLLTWAVHEQQARDRGVDDPTQQVADWWVARTQARHLTDLLATYETQEAAIDTYRELRREYADTYDTEWLHDHGHLVPHEAADAADTDIPVFAPSLPTRDVDPSALRESILDELDEAED